MRPPVRTDLPKPEILMVFLFYFFLDISVIGEMGKESEGNLLNEICDSEA